MDHVYENIEEYNPNKKRKKLIVFDDVIARGRKIRISLVFITQSCFAVPKNIRLFFTPCFSMMLPNKRELQQIAFNH